MPLPRCGSDRLLQAAARIGDQLRSSGRANATRNDAAGNFDLYDGELGTALFWAAMANVHPEHPGRHGELSREALSATRRQLAEWVLEPALFDRSGVGLGGLRGLGAALYGLASVSTLLGDRQLLAEALAAAALVTPERVARHRSLDLVNGTAGTLLALRSVQRAAANRGLSGAMAEYPGTAMGYCCERILAAHRSDGGWIADGRAFCGFAHGAAGILYALSRGCDGGTELREVARQAMAFEERFYRPALGNWLPFDGFPESDQPQVSWCWGAPGIALGRIAALDTFDDRRVRKTIENGLETTCQRKQTFEDHICCGNLGRALILAWAATRLPETEIAASPHSLLDAADRLVDAVLRRAERRGRFGWTAPPREDEFQPSFFKGAGGAGYALLYLGSQGRLPLPLLLEPPRAELPCSG